MVVSKWEEIVRVMKLVVLTELSSMGFRSFL